MSGGRETHLALARRVRHESSAQQYEALLEAAIDGWTEDLIHSSGDEAEQLRGAILKVRDLLGDLRTHPHREKPGDGAYSY